MKVRAIDFVVYHVSDIPRATDFYQNTLGIEDSVLYSSENWTEFDTKPVSLSLAAWEGHEGTGAIALAVDDVHAAVEELRQKGVPIVMEPVDSSVCWMAWVSDPDGNLVCIHSRHDGTAG